MILAIQKFSNNWIANAKPIHLPCNPMPGFDVDEIVANDIVNDNLIIQFVSFKEFFQKDGNEISLYPQTVEAVLSGKGQFLGTLFDSGKGVEALDTFFVT